MFSLCMLYWLECRYTHCLCTVPWSLPVPMHSTSIALSWILSKPPVPLNTNSSILQRPAIVIILTDCIVDLTSLIDVVIAGPKPIEEVRRLRGEREYLHPTATTLGKPPDINSQNACWKDRRACYHLHRVMYVSSVYVYSIWYIYLVHLTCTSNPVWMLTRQRSVYSWNNGQGLSGGLLVNKLSTYVSVKNNLNEADSLKRLIESSYGDQRVNVSTLVALWIITRDLLTL